MASLLSADQVNEMKAALLKNGAHRSYDEILQLKSYLSGTDFVRNIVGNALLPKQMDELCRSLVLESYNAGDVVIKQGDPGDRMYLVLKGLCEVRLKQTVELAHGLSEVREKALYQCSNNMHFGEKALQNDEPRGASVVALDYSDLVVIHKFTYSSLIKSAIADAESIASRNDKPGTKAHCLKILGKKSQFRTKLEVEAVAGYLDWRIPFFRKFTPEQQIELCRVSQAVSIYGETVLFKQGSVGQAFYIVLTGTVEVWVASQEEMALQNVMMQQALANTTGSSAAKGAQTQNPLKHGIGTKVAILSVGDTFGERALENEDSKRMASICTCESLTELIVIQREDYYKLVAALTNDELMYKITLLRKTDLFRNVDAIHLENLARYMVRKRYDLDDVVAMTGEKATEMIVTDIGECVVEVNVSTFTSGVAKTNSTADDEFSVDASGVMSDMLAQGKHKKTLEVGRIAPHSVIAPYVTQVNSMYDHVYHPETIVATTLVTAYTISLQDLYNNVNKESKDAIIQLVKDYVACTIPGLWETQATRVGDKEWRRQAAWDKYCVNLRNPAKSMTYLESLKSLSNVHLTIDSGNIFQNTNGAYKPSSEDICRIYPETAKLLTGGAFANTSNSVQESTSQSVHSLNTRRVDKNWGIPDVTKTKTRNYLNELDYDLNAVHPAVAKALSATTEREKRRQKEAALAEESGVPARGTAPTTSASSAIDTYTSDELMAQWLEKKILDPEEKPFRHAFSLVHIHQKRLQPSAASLGAQRMLKSYLRLCGSLSSCTHAKEAAETQMQSALLLQYDSDLSKQDQLRLKWRAFSTFESMPLRNSDIFIVYCRSIPVEYACITPEKDLMDFTFPAFCKQKNQFYACCIMKGLTPPELPLPANDQKRRRRQRKPWKEDKYGNLYEDTDDEGSDDEMTKTEREDNITAAGLPANHSYKLGKFSQQLKQPVFLQELGSFSETLATSAIQRTCILFGKVTQSNMAKLDPIAATFDPSVAEMAMTAPGIGLASVTGSSPTRTDAFSTTKSSGTIAKFTSEDKKICVLPLYEWLPITESTMKEFDIVNICNADEKSKLNSAGLSAGMTTNQVSFATSAPGNTSKFKGNVDIRGPDGLEISFKEAGMSSPPSYKMKSNNSKSLSELSYLDDIAREVTRKALRTTVEKENTKIIAQRTAEIKQQKEEARRKLANDMKPENRKAAVQNIIRQQMLEESPASKVEKSEAGDMSFIETEEKKQSLSSILTERKRMIALNDKLCYDEGKLKPGKRSKRIRKMESKLTNADDDGSDEDENIGDFSILSKSNSTSALPDSGVYTAGKVDINSYKRGVTLAKSQSSGNFGPGGMGLLRQRMSMYDSLNHLAPTRKVVEKSLLKKKEEQEEANRRKKKPVVTAEETFTPPGKEKKFPITDTIDTLAGILGQTKMM